MLPNTIRLINYVRHIKNVHFSVLRSLLNIKKRTSLNRFWANIERPNKLDVLIIAGGPSFTSYIRDQVIANRENIDVVAINYFCLSEASEKLVPDYYVLSDPQNFKTKDAALIEKNNALKIYLKKYRCKLCLPYGSSCDEYGNPSIFFDDQEYLFSNNIDPRFPRGYRSNTMFKAIALMLALGYEKIYLTGFDFDYPRKIFLDKDNKLMLRDEHHYGVVDSDLCYEFDSVAHALHWWAQDYWHLKKLSSPRVVNVTDNSMVDAFQRMSPSDFFQHLENS